MSLKGSSQQHSLRPFSTVCQFIRCSYFAWSYGNAIYLLKRELWRILYTAPTCLVKELYLTIEFASWHQMHPRSCTQSCTLWCCTSCTCVYFPANLPWQTPLHEHMLHLCPPMLCMHLRKPDLTSSILEPQLHWRLTKSVDGLRNAHWNKISGLLLWWFWWYF